jgi:ACS family hexuronate transporter-like MFS transporter
LFAATTLNYVDRQMLSVLAPELGHAIGWNELQYGYIVGAFQGAYALGLLVAGAVIDRLGTRLGYALAICLWSAAAMSHALARTVVAFAAARFFLGLGEAGNFPAAVKTVAEWFPLRERAFATGIFNAGANVGAIVAPLAAPILVTLWGWPSAFLFTGVLSAIWLVTWLRVYPDAAHRGPASTGDSDAAGGPSPVIRSRWWELLRHRQSWALVAAKLLTDPVWWFLLFWLPKFLNSQYGLSLTQIGLPLIAIYLMADAGSIAGGWLAGYLLRRGWTANRARKTTMLVCALAVVPLVLVTTMHDLWVSVVLIGLAMAGHQGWSANVYTLASDLFPRPLIGSVVGLGAFAGAASGFVLSIAIGTLLQLTGSYVPIFLVAPTIYLLALAIVHGLVPRLQPAAMVA